MIQKIEYFTFRIQSPHVPGLVSVKRPDLDLMTEHSIRVLFEEHLVDRHVHSGDNFLQFKEI